MKTKKLQKDGPETSAIGLGCMGMSDFYGAAQEAESIQVINRALSLGLNFLDTADMYGIGKNEILLQQALGSRRDEAFICTKFGIVRDETSGEFIGINGKPEYVKQACEASLKRLGTDRIDLYYQHRVDPEVPIEDTVGAMAELVTEGKVRFLGLSEAAPETLRRACNVHQIAALQTEYSLWSRQPEDELLGLCRELGTTFVAYSPLGRGFLTGRFEKFEDLDESDWRRDNPRFQGENFQKNLDLVKEVEKIAREKGITPAQLALVWIMTKDDNIVPIPGTTSVKRLEENAASVDIELTPEEMRRIEEAFPRDAVAGTRYPEAAMEAVNR